MANPSIHSIRTSFSARLQPVAWSDWHVEYILTVCRKTRIKVITTPTHNKNKYNKDPIKLKVKTSKLPDARKNCRLPSRYWFMCGTELIGRKEKRGKFSRPIQELSEANLCILGLLKNNSSWCSWLRAGFPCLFTFCSCFVCLFLIKIWKSKENLVIVVFKNTYAFVKQQERSDWGLTMSVK